MPTGAKDNSIPTDAPAQTTGLIHQIQRSETLPPVTTPQPPKKGRRKLNRAIFDVDTAAALRIKAQVEHPMVKTNDLQLPEVTVQQEAMEAILPDPLFKAPSDSAPVEHPLDVGNVAKEQLCTQSKDVGSRNSQSTHKLIRVGAH